MTIVYALDYRRALSGRWGCMVASGIVDMGLGVLLPARLPSAGLWALGLLGGGALICVTLVAQRTRLAPAFAL